MCMSRVSLFQERAFYCLIYRVPTSVCFNKLIYLLTYVSVLKTRTVV